MNVLALETSTDILHLALQTEQDYIAQTKTLGRHFSEEFNRAHELLLRGQAIDPNDPAIKHLQSQLGIEEDDNVIDG